MRACVVGIGKIGLPLALQIASSGHEVIGADINSKLVEDVLSGIEPFPGEEGLKERLKSALQEGLFDATTDVAKAVSLSDVVVVAVPLIVDENKSPDFRALDAATSSIAEGITEGTLVSYETTLPVGTTRDRFTPMIAEKSGLEPGVNLFLCFSPERVFSGRVFADLRKFPKIVGGIDEASTKRGCEFYEAILEFDDRPDLPQGNGVWNVGTSETSELVKLAETTYRDVNIALANEFGRYTDRVGINIETVIEAANSQPCSHIHRPGVAVGGHCIPVYPHLYLSTDSQAVLPQKSREVNSTMPAYTVDRLSSLVGGLEGKAAVVLGAAYRGDVKELAFSGVFPVVAELRERGAVVYVHDPLYSDQEIEDLGFDPFHFGGKCDGLILQADHSSYRDLKPEDFDGLLAVVDGRGFLEPSDWLSAGVSFAAIGRGDL